MSSIVWEFTIGHYPRVECAPNALGIFTRSVSDILRLSEVSGISCRGSDISKVLEVSEPEGSPALLLLLSEIKEMYGFTPSKSKVVPADERCRVFGVQKVRTYNDLDITDCRYLCLKAGNAIIADGDQRNEHQISQDLYVIEKRSERPGVDIGALSPFHAIGVSSAIKDILDPMAFVGIKFEAIANSVGLWKLSSSILLPESILPLVDQDGSRVACDGWNGKFGEKYFDDDGIEPFELVYRGEELQALEPFDVAITAEKTATTRSGAYSWLVVSQRFKHALDRYGADSINYVPVHVL